MIKKLEVGDMVQHTFTARVEQIICADGEDFAYIVPLKGEAIAYVPVKRLQQFEEDNEYPEYKYRD